MVEHTFSFLFEFWAPSPPFWVQTLPKRLIMVYSCGLSNSQHLAYGMCRDPKCRIPRTGHIMYIQNELGPKPSILVPYPPQTLHHKLQFRSVQF